MEKNIKSVTVFKKDYFSGTSPTDADIEEIIYTRTVYDEKKNIVKEEKYFPDGSIEQLYDYRYNEQGQLIEEILYHEENEIADRKTFENDENGRIIKEFRHYQDGTADTTFYKYDEYNNLIEKISVDSDNQVESKEINEYNNGKLVKKEIFEGEKELVLLNIFSFDEKGNEIESVTWDSEENKKRKFVNEFDDKGQKIKTLVYNDAEQLIARTTFSFNDKNQISQIVEESAYDKNTITLIYDEQNNVIKEEEFNKDNVLNYILNKKYDPDNLILESEVSIDRHGQGMNQHYILRYDYKFLE